MFDSPYADPHPLDGLIHAITQASEEDSLINTLTSPQWEIFSAYIQPMTLTANQMLFLKGSSERTLYFVESGSVSVHFEDASERVRLAIVAAGSVVGEGAFFSHRARTATVQANGAVRLWSLTALRFTELGNRHPEVALAVSLAVGGVLAKRLGSGRQSAATT